MKKFNTLDKRISIIQQIVEDNELILEKPIKDIIELINKEEDVLIDSSFLQLGDQVDIIFYEQNGEYNENNIINNITSAIDFNVYEKFEIVIFAHTMEEKIRMSKSVKEELEIFFKENRKSKKIWEYRVPFIGNEENKSISIGVDSTISILEYNHKEPKAEGQVYNAKLFDLIGLYNVLGDFLFKDNVRDKIENVLDVDTEIQKTLQNAPNNFWFFNNGITLMVDEDKIYQKREFQIDIDIDSINDAGVSVINGAQTVSVAAFYYYRLVNDIQKWSLDEKFKAKLEVAKEELKRAKEIMVLLRIVKKDKMARNADFYREISISLNRQKAINDVDIRYTEYLIDDVNNLSENQEAPYFFIDKREDKVRKKLPRHYSIEQFVKVSAIYLLQEPGSARSAKGKYIKQDTQWNRLNISKKGEIDESLFLKRYRPYIIVEKMFDIISKKLNAAAKTDITSVAIGNTYKYCSEFLCAYIVWVANGNRNDDFSKFPENCTWDEKKLMFIINEFVKAVIAYFPNEEIESNLFKKDKKYLELRDYLDKNKLINSMINSLFTV